MKTALMTAAAALSLVLGNAYAADATSPKAPSAQQQKMKQCNADAKGKKGDERRAYMKQCLSKKA